MIQGSCCLDSVRSGLFIGVWNGISCGSWTGVENEFCFAGLRRKVEEMDVLLVAAREVGKCVALDPGQC